MLSWYYGPQSVPKNIPHCYTTSNSLNCGYKAGWIDEFGPYQS